MSDLIKLALRARRYYPNAGRRQAASQAIKFAIAKTYLVTNKLEAVATDSGFKYARSTGSVL